MQLARR